jgi:hypothetical protein
MQKAKVPAAKRLANLPVVVLKNFMDGRFWPWGNRSSPMLRARKP